MTVKVNFLCQKSFESLSIFRQMWRHTNSTSVSKILIYLAIYFGMLVWDWNSVSVTVSEPKLFLPKPKLSFFQLLLIFSYTANMCSGIAMEVHLKNCNFEKIQFSTVVLGSLYFLQVKNCNFSIIFMYSILHRIECSYYKFSLHFKNTTKKL